MTNSEPTDRPFRVLLWGAPSVGKTSALAAYIGRASRGWIDREDDRATPTTLTKLLDKWNRFANNQLPMSTTKMETYGLRHAASGRVIEFYDTRGGGTVDLDETERRELIACDAVILFVTWPTGEAKPLVALNNAITFVGNKPAILALTKVEAHLRLEEVGLFLYDPIGLARKHRFPDFLINAMSTHYRGHVYPISVFGYRDDGLPAYVFDEFGRFLPWGVSPLNVHLPFEDIIGRLQ